MEPVIPEQENIGRKQLDSVNKLAELLRLVDCEDVAARVWQSRDFWLSPRPWTGLDLQDAIVEHEQRLQRLDFTPQLSASEAASLVTLVDATRTLALNVHSALLMSTVPLLLSISTTPARSEGIL